MQAYDMWYKLIATNPANSMASSYSATLASAQANFVNGKSAMIPYAQWAKFELSAIADNGTLPFNIAMMKTPKATASAADCNYMDFAGGVLAASNKLTFELGHIALNTAVDFELSDVTLSTIA